VPYLLSFRGHRSILGGAFGGPEAGEQVLERGAGARRGGGGEPDLDVAPDGLDGDERRVVGTDGVDDPLRGGRVGKRPAEPDR